MNATDTVMNVTQSTRRLSMVESQESLQMLLNVNGSVKGTMVASAVITIQQAEAVVDIITRRNIRHSGLTIHIRHTISSSNTMKI